jgi:hypothetical protein
MIETGVPEMQLQGQQILKPVRALFDGEISGTELLGELEAHKGKTLIFSYDGRDVQAGYHVTEVKTAAFQALDCGANYESWQETFIQLWDIPQEDHRRFMPVEKFLAIIGKVSAKIPLDSQAKVTFEVSDGRRPMSLYRASSLATDGDVVRVELTPRPASCKPRDRWLEDQAGCRPSQSEKSCCG